jgi:nitrogen regulatory protein PII
MEKVNRVEIIIDALEVNEVLPVLDAAGVTDYTVVPHATGKNRHGLQSGDDISGVFTSSYILFACTDEDLKKVVDAVRPVLAEYGGQCLITEARLLRS